MKKTTLDFNLRMKSQWKTGMESDVMSDLKTGKKVPMVAMTLQTRKRREDYNVDFVLVYNKGVTADQTKKMNFFLENLDGDFEMDPDIRKKTDELKMKCWENLDGDFEMNKNKEYITLQAREKTITMMKEFLRIESPHKSVENKKNENTNWFSKIPSNPLTSSLRMIEDRDKKKEKSDNDNECITPAQRSYMVHEILQRTKYSDKLRGVGGLVKNGILETAFPLHDDSYERTKTDEPLSKDDIKDMSDRQLLFETWARPGRWHCFQPLDIIRRYFGEKIGMYFAWLGFYTMMLIPPSVVGLIVFFYGLATMYTYPPSEEICDESRAGNLTMCPLCDTDCDFWPLKTSCEYSRLTYLFDNEATIFFSCFMTIWATLFLELWKRTEALLKYKWGMSTFQKVERLRPEILANADEEKLQHNSDSGEYELVVPLWIKYCHVFTSSVTILFMISLVVAAVVAVIVYEMVIVAVLYANDRDGIRKNASLLTTATAAVINLVIITFLNMIYEHLAVYLTNMEEPRTNTEYNDSFTLKMFFFQFIDFYASIFYVAFFKGRLGGHPGHYRYVLGYRSEECDPAGCLTELCIQLSIIMVGDQLMNNFKELVMPMMKVWYRRHKTKKTNNVESGQKSSRHRKDAMVEENLSMEEQPKQELFEEYLEMVIQYGFVTIFVAAFPLAPLFALLNNIIEIRLDAYKFIVMLRRPVALRADSIGIWYGILRSVSFFAVLTNAFIIAWTSDFVPKLVYKMTISPDKSLVGYVNYSLSYFDVRDFMNDSRSSLDVKDVKYCRYSGYRHPPGHENEYEFTDYYWHVLVARLAFVIVFEHFVFLLVQLVAWLVPDVPRDVRMGMLKEDEERFDDAKEKRKKTD